MIRHALFAAALLAASTGAYATGFGHVETHVLHPVPHLSLSIGSLLHDGFNVTYGFGGDRHITHRHASRVVVVPQPVRVIHRHSHANRHDHGRRAWRDHDRHDDHRGWDKHKRRGDDRRGRDRNRSRH